MFHIYSLEASLFWSVMRVSIACFYAYACYCTVKYIRSAHVLAAVIKMPAMFTAAVFTKWMQQNLAAWEFCFTNNSRYQF